MNWLELLITLIAFLLPWAATTIILRTYMRNTDRMLSLLHEGHSIQRKRLDNHDEHLALINDHLAMHEQVMSALTSRGEKESDAP